MFEDIYHNFQNYLRLYFVNNSYLYKIYKVIVITIIFCFLLSKIIIAEDKGCFSYDCLDDREINVLIVYDSNYFTEKLIKNLLLENFKVINEFYYSLFKINWKISSYQHFSFRKDIANISELHSFYRKELKNILSNNGSEVLLSFVGHDVKGLGIAGTFSNIVMVANFKKLDLTKSSIIIAHEFGHLFGAWHTQKDHDFMLLRGAHSFETSTESRAIIKLMRNYNFRSESIIKSEKLLKRISRIYKRHHARKEINPVSRLLTDEAYELYKNKNYTKASEILKKSISYYGKWGKTRMLLAKTYYELEKYNESFVELTRAVFFGAKPDLIFEKKLNNKFVELQKVDPDIVNPFFSN